MRGHHKVNEAKEKQDPKKIKKIKYGNLVLFGVSTEAFKKIEPP